MSNLTATQRRTTQQAGSSAKTAPDTLSDSLSDPLASAGAVQMMDGPVQKTEEEEELQMKVDPLQADAGDVSVPEVASAGLEGSGGAVPFADQIQQSFGSHDISGVKAHTGSRASKANEKIGGKAYAKGDQIAFKGTPDLHTTAHEVAHTVQQKAGLSLPGNVGSRGDRHEVHADKVADAVVAGKSAEPLLNEYGVSPKRDH